MKLSFSSFAFALAFLPAVRADTWWCMYDTAGTLDMVTDDPDEKKGLEDNKYYVAKTNPSIKGEIEDCPDDQNDSSFPWWCMYDPNGTLDDVIDDPLYKKELEDTKDYVAKTNPSIKKIEDCPGDQNDSSFSASPAPPSASGDPHFKTWSGEKYDFNGGCDLVLLQNPKFAAGLGMHVHARTLIHSWWSLIQAIVVQVGPNTLEVEGSITGEAYYRLNGGPKLLLTTKEITMGDFSVHLTLINDRSARARIDLGHGDALSVRTHGSFVRLDVGDKSGKAFVGSSGLFGLYPGGEKMSRDGVTIMEDVNDFGQEWMVRSTDAMLFYGADPSLLPSACPMPQLTLTEGRRRLGEAAISEEDASLACARVNEGDRDACIFDVLATNDLDMVGSY